MLEMSAIIRGPRIYLKQVEKSDYPDYVRWCKSRESIGKFQFFVPNVADEEVIRLLDETLKEKKYEMFIITKNDSNKNIGWIDCNLPDRFPFVVQIGYTIAEVAERGNHFATETVMLILRYLFSKKDTNRVQATVDPLNAPSWRVLRANGFQREGKLLGYYKTESGFKDNLIFGITRAMWETIQTTQIHKSQS